MQSNNAPEWDEIRSDIREHLRTTFGVENTAGIELFILLQRVAHLYQLLDNLPNEDLELSGSRWRLLMRLFVEEQNGNEAGLTPTELSRSQHVTRNTISSLLRGLESQGLIQRQTVPSDLRAFRIQLTPAGRDYLHANAGRRMAALDRMLSGIDPQEYVQLTGLLNKLHHSLSSQVHLSRCTPTPNLSKQTTEE
jgi:DNA-binding MarR family transcriptional regulator